MSTNHNSSDESGVSRRGFLKGLGVGTVSTGVLSDASLHEAQAAEPGVKGPGATAIVLNVNGENKQLNIEPRVTLLDALRNRLDLTGPKKVCDRGSCGACTVLVDGDPMYACSLLAVESQGREITTVEGLGTTEKMNEVQKAFVDRDAQQCGFCTPGFVTACSAFVRDNPNASVDEVKNGLGGNLCRCGTYAGMVLAASDAAREKGDA
jgi:xanthine dehydrogenase YagT iron-sulfur-binding subunit